MFSDTFKVKNVLFINLLEVFSDKTIRINFLAVECCKEVNFLLDLKITQSTILTYSLRTMAKVF